VSSQPIVIPTTHRRRFLTATHPSVFIEPSPVGVCNKIKAIQARKTRFNPLPNNPSYTDIRPLNFGYTGSASNSKAKVTIWTAEKLVDRSKDIRLDRIHTRQPPRRSVLSTTSTNQQLLVWPNYQSSNPGSKQPQPHSNSTTLTPPAIRSINNKSSGGKMPEIPRRQPLIDRQNSMTPIELQQKLTCSERTNNNNILLYETEEDVEDDEEEEDLLMDKEFEQYLESATVKCADWLMKYVFNEKNN